MTADEAVARLVETLEQIQRILPGEKIAWDSNHLVRLAIERLWITAGNVAEEYRRAAGVDAGVEPWAELAAYRIASLMPSPAICPPIASGPTPSPTCLASSRRSAR